MNMLVYHIDFRKINRYLTVSLFLISIKFVLFTSKIFGQANDNDSLYYVTGLVRDAITKKPINSAQIYTLIYESGIVTTDSNGIFKIKIYTPEEIICVKAYDYNTREISIRGKKNLTIDLYSDKFKNYYITTEELNKEQKNIFSIYSKNQAIVTNNKEYITIDDVIQDNLGGDIRSIKKSGLSGIGCTYLLRGFNTINLNSQPLIIVDGILWNNLYSISSLHENFYNNLFAMIDPSDVDEITVIKDATSIYGIKGSNGIIKIKTKRSKDMATKIDFNAMTGISEIPNTIPVMDAQQFRIYLTDMLGTMNLSKDEIDAMKFLQDNPSERNYLKYHNNTNWVNQIYRRGMFQKYNISVNGGDNRALYYFSVGYTGTKEALKNVDMERLNTRFNADFSFSERINMGLNIGFTNIDRNLLDDGVNYYTSPTFLALIKAPFLNPYSYTYDGTLTTDLEDSDDFGIGNPVAIIKNSLNTNKQYRLNIGLRPSIKINRNITLNNQFEYILHKIKETYYRPILGSATIYIPGFGFSENVFKSQQVRNFSINNDFSVIFDYKLKNKHKIEAFAGVRYIADFIEAKYAEGHNSGSDQKRNLLNEEMFKNTSGEDNKVKSISNYYSLNYSFNNRYIISTALSIDYSSNVGNEVEKSLDIFNHKWGIFPSLNLGWLISSEKFMREVQFVDLLKIRIGLQYTGNDNIKPYSTLPYLSSVKYIDKANGLVIKNIGNTKLKWETTEKLNFGLDANLFNDKIYLVIDLYRNITKDVIRLKKLPYIIGDNYYYENGGKISNVGLEFSTILKLINKNMLKLETGTTIGHYKNKIVSLPEKMVITNVYNCEILSSEGNPVGLFYGYKTNGIYTTESEAKKESLKIIDRYGNERLLHAGDVRFIDINGDGIINDNDKQVIGNPNPDFYGSFYSNLIYKRLTVSIVFNFSYGNKIYNYLRSELESGGATSMILNQSTAMLARWCYEGQNTNQPRIEYGDPVGNARFSDRWIEDGSYLRLKRLLINYDLPMKNNVVRGINFWVSFNNLFTITKYLGVDPEVSMNNDVLLQGIDVGLLPVSRSINLGIKLNL